MSDNAVLLQGDCLEVLKDLPDNSVDSLITDPPAGISFMGKAWDEDKGGRKQWVAWMAEVMTECLRVLKPGAHGLVWAIPRTSHWTASALEDAGFEIRDVVTHVFGSGFPKSMDISKAIDKQAGAVREVLGPNIRLGDKKAYAKNIDSALDYQLGKDMGVLTAPSTPEAKKWQGWGTALKPASEHWILVRKPCSEKTVAANVLQHGTGGINIDASRISLPSDDPQVLLRQGKTLHAQGKNDEIGTAYSEGVGKFEGSYFNNKGRFPANFILSHNPDCVDEHEVEDSIYPALCTEGCAVAELDKQFGVLKTNPGTYRREHREGDGNTYRLEGQGVTSKGDSGGASRFFYVAKASKKDKGADNMHPTVKSSGLMSYLIKLITPPGGIVLDPFMGSGSTGVAAVKEGFDFIGIEKEEEYFQISQKRVG